jgi:hypothetical protein
VAVWIQRYRSARESRVVWLITDSRDYERGVSPYEEARRCEPALVSQ